MPGYVYFEKAGAAQRGVAQGTVAEVGTKAFHQMTATPGIRAATAGEISDAGFKAKNPKAGSKGSKAKAGEAEEAEEPEAAEAGE